MKIKPFQKIKLNNRTILVNHVNKKTGEVTGTDCKTETVWYIQPKDIKYKVKDSMLEFSDGLQKLSCVCKNSRMALHLNAIFQRLNTNIKVKYIPESLEKINLTTSTINQ